jgi:hypothetical protein
VLFKARLSVGRHGKGLLLHGHVIYTGSRDFFSIALDERARPVRRERG